MLFKDTADLWGILGWIVHYCIIPSFVCPPLRKLRFLLVFALIVLLVDDLKRWQAAILTQTCLSQELRFSLQMKLVQHGAFVSDWAINKIRTVASNAITTSSVKTPYELICSILEGLCQNIIHPFRETWCGWSIRQSPAHSKVAAIPELFSLLTRSFWVVVNLYWHRTLPHPIVVISCYLQIFPLRSVQFIGELDDCAQHQTEPLHCTWPAEWHQVHLCCQGD